MQQLSIRRDCFVGVRPGCVRPGSAVRWRCILVAVQHDVAMPAERQTGTGSKSHLSSLWFPPARMQGACARNNYAGGMQLVLPACFRRDMQHRRSPPEAGAAMCRAVVGTERAGPSSAVACCAIETRERAVGHCVQKPPPRECDPRAHEARQPRRSCQPWLPAAQKNRVCPAALLK